MKHLKHLQFVFLAALLICGVKTGYAQNVTISPTSGKLIGTKGMNGASVEVGLGRGQSAMWRHDQLPLTFTTSDDTGLTSEGQLSVHANNLKVDNGYLAIVGTTSSYFELSLPKGYRFTGYKIVLNDVYGTTFSGVAVSRKESTFAEKSSDFKTTLSNVATIPATLDTNNPDYVVQRTAGAKTDMSNVLYFNFTQEDLILLEVTLMATDQLYVSNLSKLPLNAIMSSMPLSRQLLQAVQV